MPSSSKVVVALKHVLTFVFILLTQRTRSAFDYLRDPEYYETMQREYRKK